MRGIIMEGEPVVVDNCMQIDQAAAFRASSKDLPSEVAAFLLNNIRLEPLVIVEDTLDEASFVKVADRALLVLLTLVIKLDNIEVVVAA